MLTTALDRAVELLDTHAAFHEAVATALLAREVLQYEDLALIRAGLPIEPTGLTTPDPATPSLV
jgi:ATP-dependent Zn protease